MTTNKEKFEALVAEYKNYADGAHLRATTDLVPVLLAVLVDMVRDGVDAVATSEELVPAWVVEEVLPTKVPVSLAEFFGQFDDSVKAEDTPTEITEAPVVEVPVAVVEEPAPVVEVPVAEAPIVEVPVAVVEEPAPVVEAPVVVETPAVVEVPVVVEASEDTEGGAKGRKGGAK